MGKFGVRTLLIFTLYFCNPVPDWKGGENSIPEVMQKAYNAIKDNNVGKLNEITLSREEHNQLFWKYIGERYTTDKGMTADSAYEFMSMETNLSAQSLKNSISGLEDKIESRGCRRVETYGPFRLHLGCEFIAHDNLKKEYHFKNLHGIIEYKNSFKVYNFKRN